MGAIITTAATMLCPHGGTVTGTVAGSKRATAGAQILTVNDTFLIAGCAFNIASVPHPCVRVQWITGAYESMAVHGAILTTDAQGLCLAADQAPQGPPILTPAQTRAMAR
jgi:hypothetical protein